jgi:hypothetical protein
MKQYFPYPSDKANKKFFIITKHNKKVYFGDSKYEDYTVHKNNKKKEAYIKRHEKNENWTASGIDTAGWWSVKYLWSYPTKKEAYEKIKKTF